MLYPSIYQLTPHHESRYSLVIAVSKRARQIAAQAKERGIIITEKPVKICQKLNRRPLPYQEKMCYYLNHKNVDCRATPVSH